jgi:hypothetical protein
VQEAMDHTITLIRKGQVAFEAAERRLPLPTGDPTVDKDIRKFVQGCKDICTGVINWRLETLLLTFYLVDIDWRPAITPEGTLEIPPFARTGSLLSSSDSGARVVCTFSVGRVMADGTDEDGAYAARMDEWVAWETVEGTAPRGEG